MTRTLGAPLRALIVLTATGSTLLSVGAVTASAHVHAEADNPSPGSNTIVGFRVPGESETGALTTEVSVALPDLTSVRTELLPGWTARLDRDIAAGTVRSVTWTAAPGTGISSEQFALFRISVKLPEAESVSFPATQTYSDGTVVRWDQPALPDGGEPEYPAPVLELTGTAGAGDQHSVGAAHSADAPAMSDTAARWLAGGALLVGAAAMVAALTNRRRS